MTICSVTLASEATQQSTRLAPEATQLNTEHQIKDLDCANDSTLIESCKQRLQELLKAVRDRGQLVGLRINTDKTKSMAVTDSLLHLRCNNQDIEQVLEFEYTGSTMINTGKN